MFQSFQIFKLKITESMLQNGKLGLSQNVLGCLLLILVELDMQPNQSIHKESLFSINQEYPTRSL